MLHDIVARLRAVLHNDRSVELMNREAADEIERLRAVVEAWLKYSQRAERDIETLRAERDEARRERDGYLEGNRQTLAALAEANEIAKGAAGALTLNGTTGSKTLFNIYQEGTTSLFSPTGSVTYNLIQYGSLAGAGGTPSTLGVSFASNVNFHPPVNKVRSRASNG